jgi:hypothetical protein
MNRNDDNGASGKWYRKPIWASVAILSVAALLSVGIVALVVFDRNSTSPPPNGKEDVEVQVIKSEIDVAADGRSLLIRLSVSNLSRTRKVEFQSWRTDPVVRLTDDLGNNYRQIKGQQRDPVVLYTGKPVPDVLEFQAPIDAVSFLDLVLPAANYGGSGEVRFRLAATDIQGSKAHHEAKLQQLHKEQAERKQAERNRELEVEKERLVLQREQQAIEAKERERSEAARQAREKQQETERQEARELAKAEAERKERQAALEKANQEQQERKRREEAERKAKEPTYFRFMMEGKQLMERKFYTKAKAKFKQALELDVGEDATNAAGKALEEAEQREKSEEEDKAAYWLDYALKKAGVERDSRLRELVEKYPNTKAAKDAKLLLGK